jgi:hypothetical protein
MKTPIQKAFADYLSNRYYTVQLMALLIFSAFLYYADEFESTFDIILILIPICGAFFVPFIFIFIWASQYKKGTRK